MNFKEEYKKSADSISPDKEAIDRMKAAVLAELSKEPETAPKTRKPLPFKRIAIIGGAAAACAVITVSAISILPSIRFTGGMVEESEDTSAMSMAEGAMSCSSACDDTAGSQAASTASAANSVGAVSYSEECVSAADDAKANDITETGTEFGTPDYVPAEPEAAEAFPAEPSAAGGQVNGIQTEQAEAQTIDSAVSAEVFDSTYEHTDMVTPDFSAQQDAGAAEKQPGTDGVMTASEPDMPDEAQDDGREEPTELAETAEASELPNEGKVNPCTGGPAGYIETTDSAETDDGFDGNPMTGPPSYLSDTTECLETLDCGAFTEEATCEASYDATYEAPSPEASVPKLVLTGKGWLTYDGERYNEDKEIKPAAMPELIVKSQNVMDKRFYYVNLDGDILTLYDEKMNFIGAYRKR